MIVVRMPLNKSWKLFGLLHDRLLLHNDHWLLHGGAGLLAGLLLYLHPELTLHTRRATVRRHTVAAAAALQPAGKCKLL